MGSEFTCRQLIAFLDDYLSGEQALAVRAEFERHLADCPACRSYLAEYETTVRLARSAGDDTPTDAPEELIQAILAARGRGDGGTTPPPDAEGQRGLRLRGGGPG